MPLSSIPYGEDVGTVSRVAFGILSPERIKEKSVCEVYRHITSYKNLEGTLMDPRLGSMEKGVICQTCKQDNRSCPGHFGHMNLAKPVIQIQYLANIINLLACYCNRCSALRINKYDPEIMGEIKTKKGKGRYTFVTNWIKTKGKNKPCFNCGAPQPDYRQDKEGIAKILATYGEKSRIAQEGTGKKSESKLPQTLNPEIIHGIFKNISDEDVELMGLNPAHSRPEWMIWTIMPIPPPHMRPSVKSETGKISDDDLTHKLNDVIKFNNQLRLKMVDEGTRQNYIDDWWQLVQYHVATFVDNEISNIPRSTHRSGRPLKAIRQRIKAKEGRVRGNLMGKRVNGSGRSVITADPLISLDQLGVPKKIAMNLPYPELVTPFNLVEMTQCVRNGPDVYPGAKSIKKKSDQSKKNLKLLGEERNEIKLDYGDIVFRHMMDNDWVLFNRQPSLHRSSMMGHRSKIMPWDSFRINPNVCASYNADFDGDGNNDIHNRPQQVDATKVARQTLMGKHCKPGPRYNHLVDHVLMVGKTVKLRETPKA